MKVNDKFISKLINVLERTSELGTSNVRKMEATGEGEHISASRTETASRSRYTSQANATAP